MSRRLRTLASIVAACVALTITLQGQTVYRLRFVSSSGGAFVFQSGYSGTVTSTHDGSQTINIASGFGATNVYVPEVYDNFSGGSNGSTIGGSWAHDQSGSNPPTYSNTQVRHARATLSGRANFPNPEYMSEFGLQTQTWIDNGIYIDAWEYLTYTGTPGTDYSRNVKMNWLNGAENGSTGAEGSVFFPNFWNPTVADACNMDQNNVSGGADVVYHQWAAGVPGCANYFLDNWRHISGWFVQSTTDTQDGPIWLRIDATVQVNANFVTRQTGHTGDWDRFYFGGYMGHDALGGQGGAFPFDGRIYVSDALISRSRARVEVCSSTTYAGATCEIQVPTSSSDTQIVFTLKQGAFSAFSGKSLFVTTSAGVTSRVGDWP
jgi:hypothetical protein